MAHIEQLFYLVPLLYINPYFTKFCQMSFSIEVTKLNGSRFCNVFVILVKRDYLKITDGYTEESLRELVNVFETSHC